MGAQAAHPRWSTSDDCDLHGPAISPTSPAHFLDPGLDEADGNQAGAIEAEGVRAVVAPSVMHDAAAAEALARATLG